MSDETNVQRARNLVYQDQPRAALVFATLAVVEVLEKILTHLPSVGAGVANVTNTANDDDEDLRP